MSDPYPNPFAAEEEAAATETEGREAEWGTVRLGGVAIPVIDPVTYVNLARFDPPVSFGNISKDSDRLLSPWVQDDWTGGALVADINEGSDPQRFWDSTLDTEHPGQLALRTITHRHAGPNADGCRPLGDFQNAMWFAFGTALRRWDKNASAGAGGFTGSATLGGVPVNKGVAYDNRLFVPLGASIDAWNGTAVTNHAIAAVALCEWDDKLLAMGADGQLRIYDGTAWAAVVPALKLRGDRVPRHLVVFHNRQDEDTLFVVTDRDVWAYDPLVPKLYRTGLRFPAHPDQGRGAAVWRDSDMYVSVGMGVHRYNGAVVSPVGLDGRDGVAAELRGLIVDLEPEYNGLVATVQGSVTEAAVAGMGLDETMAYDAALIFPLQQTVSSLWRWTEVGWHKLWQSPGAIGVPTWSMVSNVDGEYQLWWGYAGDAYRHPLRRAFHTPQQGAILGIDRFEAGGYHYTGRFDANMTGFDKLSSHLDVTTREGHAGSIQVEWHTDRRDWTLLGTVTLPDARTRLPFDPDGDGFAEGDAWEWIEYRYRLARGADDTKTPIVDNFVTKFLKLPLQTRSWVLRVPVRANEQWQGIGPRELTDYLDELTTTPRFHTFTLGDQTYRVRVAQATGENNTGFDRRGNRMINVLEIPVEDPLADEVA